MPKIRTSCDEQVNPAPVRLQDKNKKNLNLRNPGCDSEIIRQFSEIIRLLSDNFRKTTLNYIRKKIYGI